MATCNHQRECERWIPPEHEGESGHWEYWTEGTYEDIDTGRYRCTQCGHIGYYTGLWRAHHEGGRTLLDERTGCVRAPAAGEGQS